MNINGWRAAFLTILVIVALCIPRTAQCFTPQELIGSGGPANLSFGWSLAVNGNTAVIGATSNGAESGAVYVFTRRSSGWVQAAILTQSDAQVQDGFGLSVGISGDTVVVGAPLHTVATSQQGVVYIFAEPSAGWSNMTETAELTASDAQQIAYFGYSVAISGNAVLVGSPEQIIDGTFNRGAGYIFVRPKTGWTTTSQSANEFIVPNSVEVGWAVALDGGTAVVTAPSMDAAFVYVKPANGWSHATQTAALTSSDFAFAFGNSVAIRGDTICVGAANNGIGAAYVYQAPTGGWQNMTQTAQLTPSDGIVGESFGSAVSVSNSTIAVGAHSDLLNAGSVYLFSKPVDGWQNATQNAKLTPESGSGQFGESVFVNYRTLFIGAPSTQAVFVY